MSSFRCKFVFALVVVAVGIFCALRVEAQLVSSLKIQLKAGLDGFFKSGSYNNIYLDITNPSGSNRFKGSAEVRIDNSGIFKVNIDVPSPGHKLYVLPVFYPFEYQIGQTLIIKNALGIPIDRLKINVREIIDNRDKVVVVVNPNLSGLGSINKQSYTYPELQSITGFGVQMGLDTAVENKNPYQQNTAPNREETISRVITRYIKMEELPSSLIEYDAFNALVLHDGDYNLISTENYQALDAWVRSGKLLVLVTGDRVGRIATSKVAPLLPRTYSGTGVITGIPQGLQAFTGVSIKAGSDMVVAKGKLRAGSEVVAGSQAMPLIIRRRHGHGEVVELAFDYMNPPVSNYPSSFDESMWSGIFGSVLSRPSFEKVAVPGVSIVDLLAVQEQKNSSLIIRVVGFFLLAYIVILGPMNFFSLARFKKHTLLWITVPLTISVFTAGGILIGNVVQGGINRLTTLDQVFITQDIGTNQSSNYIVGLRSFFSAGNVKVKQEAITPNIYISNRIDPVDKSNLVMYGMNQNKFSDGYNDTIINNSGSVVVQRQQPRWSYDFDRVLGLSNEGWAFKLEEAQFEPDKLKGILTLNLPSDLYNAQLSMGSKEQTLGTLSANTPLEIAKIMSEEDLDHTDFDVWVQSALNSFRNRLVKISTNDIWLTGIVKQSSKDIGFNLRSEREEYSLVAIKLGSMNILRYDFLPRIKTVNIIREEAASKNKPRIDLRNYGYQGDEFMQIVRPEFNANETAQIDIYFSKPLPGYLKIESIENRENSFKNNDNSRLSASTYAGIESVQALNRVTGKYDTLALPLFVKKECFGPDNLVRLKIKFNKQTKIDSIRMSNIK